MNTAAEEKIKMTDIHTQQLSLKLSSVIQMTNNDLSSNVMDMSFLLEQPAASATGSHNQSTHAVPAAFPESVLFARNSK